jgi:hypothetical protein
MEMKNLVLLAVLSLMIVPAVAAAEDEAPSKSWGVSLRLGGFSTSRDWPWHRHSPQATGGFEFTRYVNRRTAISLTLDGHSFPGEYVGIAPITLNYKFFPSGHSSARPRLLPWIGGGAGIYFLGPHPFSAGDVAFGVHASGGVAVPLTSFFEISGELRYGGTSDIRMFNYIMGLGFRF